MKNAQVIYEESKRRIEEKVGDERDEFIVSQMEVLSLQLTLKVEMQRQLDAASRELAQLRFNASESSAMDLITRAMSRESRTENLPVQ